MSSTDITKNSERGYDLVIDGSSLYDLTLDTHLNDIDMDSIYHKTLASHGLAVDANVSGQTFYYLRNVEDTASVTVLTPVTDVPLSFYHQYRFRTAGYELFAERMVHGWTAEFILNFNTVGHAAPLEDLLFYMGKTQNLSGQTSGFTDNHLAIAVKDHALLFTQVKFEKDCDCDTPSDVVKKQRKQVSLALPTGDTLHHLVVVFQRDLSYSEQELLTKGAALNCDIPSNYWYDGKKFRTGSIRIYLDGLLREVFPWEEVIFRSATDPLTHVQGWGLGDESTYPLSVQSGVAGSYTGDIIRGRFYDVPLRGDAVRTNFELFSPQYGIPNPFAVC